VPAVLVLLPPSESHDADEDVILRGPAQAGAAWTVAVRPVSETF
jgi:hypothetical protein